MSVCFFVPAEQGAAAEEGEQEVVEEMVPVDTTQQTLQQFWHNVIEDIKKVNAEDFKTQALPLARIKKIMKLDEEVKMISAEAPVMFAKAAEIFIHELTLRAWQHTEDNKRRTLQRNDIAMAISKSDQFDFLIDIVPRHEVKAAARLPHDPPPRPPPEQVATSSQQATTIAQPQFIIQPCNQIIQQSSSGQSGSTSGQTVQPVALVQGDLQQVPCMSQIQLSPAQLNMIRMQMASNPGQPIVLQHPAPQIIQVTSQGQHQPQQQVYLAQVATTQDDS